MAAVHFLVVCSRPAGLQAWTTLRGRRNGLGLHGRQQCNTGCVGKCDDTDLEKGWNCISGRIEQSVGCLVKSQYSGRSVLRLWKRRPYQGRNQNHGGSPDAIRCFTISIWVSPFDTCAQSFVNSTTQAAATNIRLLILLTRQVFRLTPIIAKIIRIPLRFQRAAQEFTMKAGCGVSIRFPVDKFTLPFHAMENGRRTRLRQFCAGTRERTV